MPRKQAAKDFLYRNNERSEHMIKQKWNKKYSIHHFKHANYSRILNNIKTEYISKGEPDFLVLPYMLMCATTLEARLNDALYEHALSLWGDNYKPIADAYLSMNLRTKLVSLVPILTKNEYRINQEHFIYKRLSSLISMRNLLVHPKPTILEFEPWAVPEGQIWPFPYPPMSKEAVETISDLTMGLKETFTPIEYHEALEKLEKWFFHKCPDRLSKVAMVVARDKK